jgi:hypothetical protein
MRTIKWVLDDATPQGKQRRALVGEAFGGCCPELVAVGSDILGSGAYRHVTTSKL